MVTPTGGEVVLVPFPFSDLSQSKVRPAVCLADAGRGDWVLCQITSNPYGDPAETISSPEVKRPIFRRQWIPLPGRTVVALTNHAAWWHFHP